MGVERGALTTTRPAPRRRRWSGDQSLTVALLAPSLALILGFTIYPVVSSLWISLHRVSLILPTQPWVGLDNYAALVANPYFWDAFWRTAYFTVASLALQCALGLGIALVLNEPFPGRGVLRAIVLIPWAISTIVNGILWQWIYNAQYGALNGVLYQLGLIRQPLAWLGDPWWALNMVILADTWKMTPFYAVMFLAALLVIPKGIYESASIDGANAWRRFTSVTLPFLQPIILIILVLRTVQTFRVFDIIYILTQGGPANGTTVLAFFVYQQSFKTLNFGVGSAAAFVIGLATLGLAGGYFRLLHRETVL
jgi:multiple sugar transport system permease protein/N,N'-diacetylchitobiose transport system permease protein